jgi:4'-phosphopantetheinyl transferase
MVDKSGKPYLDMPNAPIFNISHTREYIVCVIAYDAHHLGVDIETLQRKNTIQAIYQHYFHASECEFLDSLEDISTRAHYFFKLWTLKEAYIKALGGSISGGLLRTAVFNMNTIDEPQLVERSENPWQFKLFNFIDHHYISIASQWLHWQNIHYRCFNWDSQQAATIPINLQEQ